MKGVISATIEQICRAKHFLVDYDGLLVNTEDIYFQTWCAVLNQAGQERCRTFHKGRHEIEVYEWTKPFLLQPMALEEVSAQRIRLFDEIIHSGGLSLMSGIALLLQTLAHLAPLSIVSNSTEDVVEAGLKVTGIAAYFVSKYCFRQGLRRKPTADLYNAALGDLQLPPHAVIAFEDSPSGLLAALTANAPTVCISHDTSVAPLCAAHNIPRYTSADELLGDIHAHLTGA